MDALRYLDRTGCQWAALPAGFPHHKLVYHYFKAWTADDTLTRLHDSLREQVRAQVEGRDRQPSAPDRYLSESSRYFRPYPLRTWPQRQDKHRP